MKRAFCWLWFVASFIISSPGIAQNVLLHATVVSSGGGHAQSTSFTMNSTVAQPLTGSTPSTSFKEGLGFWYENDVVRRYYAGAYVVNGGWNLVSVPKVVADYRKQSLFPNATSHAFAYEAPYQFK